MDDVANTTVVERIARVLAGRARSLNAEGDDPSAGDDVAAVWQNYTEEALSVLRAIRECDRHMAAAGDAAVWQRMVQAAIDSEKSVQGAAFGAE